MGYKVEELSVTIQIVVVDLDAGDMSYADMVHDGWIPKAEALHFGIVERTFDRLWSNAPFEFKGYVIEHGHRQRIIKAEYIRKRQRRGCPRMHESDWQREQARKRWNKDR